MLSGSDSTGRAVVPLTEVLRPFKGTSAPRLLKDKVWACMAPAAPAPSLGAKLWQGSDL